MQIAIALAVLFAAMRVVGVLGPARLRWLLPLGFTLMALTPWVFLDRAGRKAIGLRWPPRPSALFTAALAGGAAALTCFAVGIALFGADSDNWFVTIARNYAMSIDTTGWTMSRLLVFFTLPAMIFSPIGEEIFFRGYLQHALEQRFSARSSTIAECAAFGLIHLCHHGIVLVATGIVLRPVSGPLWVLLMFFAALLFAYLRKVTGSLLPSIVSHSVFNLVMNVTIFGWLWPA